MSEKSQARRESDLATREEVAARDSNRCVICYKWADDIHEIIPRSALGHKQNQLLFSPKNRVCLCRECHETAHNASTRRFLLMKLMTDYKYEYNEEVFQRYIRNEINDE